MFWVSIGSAANSYKFSRKELSSQINQQFPLFLQNIRKEFPDMKINIVLIDKYLELPPYCVDKQFDNISQNDTFKNIYHNESDFT